MLSGLLFRKTGMKDHVRQSFGNLWIIFFKTNAAAMRPYSVQKLLAPFSAATMESTVLHRSNNDPRLADDANHCVSRVPCRTFASSFSTEYAPISVVSLADRRSPEAAIHSAIVRVLTFLEPERYAGRQAQGLF
ncbi:hypothetical protein [Novosphingopyxis sp.]|uniref:hypothetical protein n=1 Tax=Novosphingopyxis sp. TaxID=2709690 RepID=UPI003B5A6BED